MLAALVYVVAAVFAAMGVYALIAPAGVLGTFGVALEAPDGRNEVRAVYGGFGLAVAAVLVFAAASPAPASAGVLLAVGVALAGMAVGRLVGIVVERPGSFYPVWFWLGAEIAMAAVLLAAASAGE